MDNDSKQGRATRIRATAATAAARVREQTVKVATAARPHAVPIAKAVGSVVTTFAVTALIATVLVDDDDDRPTGRGPSSSCRECGRRLTDALSQQAGYGPVCARHMLT
ncbi:DUF6011 domain-containing protein [Streptomyces sp. NPDC006544]|uniref:DUF6011 domain-containing protein n=1 Tax=Streptomyces sp. NPDC006544 TaxID=3154583 RepID=UPI0033BD98AA